MIIERRGSSICLSGNIHEDYWPIVEGMVWMALPHCTARLVIDCGAIQSVSVEGLDTFVAAMSFIDRSGLPLILLNLPIQARSWLENRTPKRLHGHLAPAPADLPGGEAGGPPWRPASFDPTRLRRVQ